MQISRSFQKDMDKQKSEHKARIEKEKSKIRAENAKRQRQRTKSASPVKLSPAGSASSRDSSARSPTPSGSSSSSRSRNNTAIGAFLSPARSTASEQDEEMGQDAQILLAAFREHNPRLATPQYVQKLLTNFQKKGQGESDEAKREGGFRPIGWSVHFPHPAAVDQNVDQNVEGRDPLWAGQQGGDWREVMYTEIGASLGVDPREYWQALTPRSAAEAKAKARTGSNAWFSARIRAGESYELNLTSGHKGQPKVDIGQMLAEEAAAVAARMWGTASLGLDESFGSIDEGMSQTRQVENDSRQPPSPVKRGFPALETTFEAYTTTAANRQHQQKLAPTPGLRLDPSEPEPVHVPAPEPEPELDDVAVLIAFYKDREPEFANPQKAAKILRAYRKKAEKAGASDRWREIMYAAIAEQRGEDPREHWKRVAGGRGDATTAASPKVVAVVAKDPRLLRVQPPQRQPRQRKHRSGRKLAVAKPDITVAGAETMDPNAADIQAAIALAEAACAGLVVPIIAQITAGGDAPIEAAPGAVAVNLTGAEEQAEEEYEDDFEGSEDESHE